MAIGSLLSCNDLPFEGAAISYDIAAVIDGTRPPSENYVFPLLRSTLLIPLVQSLRQVYRASDLKVDMARIQLVYGSTIEVSGNQEPLFELTSNLEGIDVP